MNVMMLLEMANSAFPDRIAFTNGATGETLSYSQLFSKAGKRAREIRASDSNRFVKLDVSSLVTPLSLLRAVGQAFRMYLSIIGSQTKR